MHVNGWLARDVAGHAICVHMPACGFGVGEAKSSRHSLGAGMGVWEADFCRCLCSCLGSWVCACICMRHTPVSVSKPDLDLASFQMIPGSLFQVGSSTTRGQRPSSHGRALPPGCAEVGACGDREDWLAVRGNKEVTEAPDERRTGRV